VVTGQQHLWGDFVTWYFPSHEYAIERIRHGALPLWNPYLDCGMPFLGEADHGTLYPPSLLLIPFAGERHRLFRALEFFTLLHLVGAGLALYALLRFLGCGRAAALTGGLVFALGGVFVARSAQLSLVTAQAWVPVALHGAYETLRNAAPGSRRRGALRTALGVGMIALSGSPSTLTITAVGLAVLTLAAVAACRTAWREALVGVLTAAGAALLGLALSGAQMVPMFEFVQASERMAYTYHEVSAFALEPDNLVMLLLPRFNGWLVYDESSYWGSANFSEVSGYTGLLALGLVVLALRLRPARETVPWAVLAVIGLWLALGPHGGLQLLLYHYLPLIGMMRAPGRYLLLWAFGLSVLAGLGLDAALRRGPQDEVRRWSALLLAAVIGLMVTVGLAAPSLVRSLDAWKQPWFLAGLGYMLPASAAAALGLGLLARARAWTPALGALVALAAAAELVIQGTGIGLVSQEERVEKLLQPGDYERLLQRDPGLFRVRDLYSEQSRLMLARLQGDSGPGRHLLEYELYRSRIASVYSGAFDLLNLKYLVAFEANAGAGRGPNVLAQPAVWLAEGEEAVLPIDPPLLARGVDVVSTVSGTWEMASGATVGELALLSDRNEQRTIPIHFGIDTGDIALGGGRAPNEVLVAAEEAVADSFTVQRRYFLARKEVEPVEVRWIRIRRPRGIFRLGIKELYLLHAEGATDTWRRVFVKPVMGDAFLNAYENIDVLPRALLFSQFEVVSSRHAALEFLRKEGVDARRQVAVELPPGMAAPPASGKTPGKATVVAYEAERIAVTAEVEGPGAWLVLSEAVFPGWTASVDGRDAPVARADGLFRTVWLPSGSHEVVFRYRPRSLSVGLAASGIAAIVLVGLAFMARPLI
jgi:hypothetical protein